MLQRRAGGEPTESSGDAALNPLVSVVIPAYNCAPYISEAIESVLSQSYANKEIIVVDDGSTDETILRVSTFGDRVRLIRQPNAGPAAARNHGVRAARGNFLAFLDGDDVWLPGKLSSQMEYVAAKQDAYVVYGDFGLWRADPTGKYPHAESLADQSPATRADWVESGYLFPQLLLDSVICIITAVIHRSVFDALGGFDEGLRVGEDYDFWIRSSRHYRAHRLCRTVALYRLHARSTTRMPRQVCGEYLVLRRALERYGTSGPDGIEVDAPMLRARMGKLCFDHGYTHFWHGSPAIAAEAFAQALRHSGFSLRATMYAVAAYLRSTLRLPGGASR